MSIFTEKFEQAHRILDEFDVDAWMVFVRESSQSADPVLPLLQDGSFTWQSAFIVTRAGDRIAIVGKFDDGLVRAAGTWTDVIPYVQSIREPLLRTIQSLNPHTLALDYSVDDSCADGLSHGMYLLLQQYFSGTPYADRILSADRIIGALRGRKSTIEIERMQAAIATAESIFDEVSRFASPGKTEREIAQFMIAAADRRGVEPAWEGPCPIVNTGPASQAGHGPPSDLQIEPGHVLHIDFGVKQDGYCSDLQRCWYVARADERRPPEPVSRAFDTVVTGISRAAELLRPGVAGWEVDAIARKVIVDAGYPEYGHALGHHVGRSAHDGAGVLGPRWERYGKTPFYELEMGNVFTLEPSIEDAGGRGCVGVEEMVLVTESGYEWLSRRQTSLNCLHKLRCDPAREC